MARTPSDDYYAPSTTTKRPIAYEFVLDALARVEPTTRAMFGSTGVYVGERVLFILRQKGDSDDGVWLAFESAAEAEVYALFPRLKPIDVLGNVRSWRKLSAHDESFEEDVLKACRLVCSGDTRLGKVPDRQKKKTKAASAQPKAKAAPRTKATKSAATKRATKVTKQKSASKKKKSA